MSAEYPDPPMDDEDTPPEGTPVPPPTYEAEEKTQEMSREDLQHIFHDIVSQHGRIPSDDD